MRVGSDIDQLAIAPGTSADLTLDIVNTDNVIDGITARVIGLPVEHATTRPTVLPLFPDTAGQLTVNFTLPRSFPAGQHPMTVEVASQQHTIDPEYVNIDLLVPSAPALEVVSRPEIVRTRRTGRYIIAIVNRGNVALDVTLRGDDPQKHCAMTVSPTLLTLPPGASAESLLVVKARRKFIGTEADHGLLVEAIARPVAGSESESHHQRTAQLPRDRDEGDSADGSLTEQALVTLRQRPVLTRGILTALVLVSIVALWASVFLFGLSKVFAGDPLTKSAPASFFAATPDEPAGDQPGGTRPDGEGASGGSDGVSSGSGGDSGSSGAGSGAGTGSGGASGGGEGSQAPAGALPKSGALPTGVGGTISGTVIAASSGQPAGRILVEAMRVKADGSTAVVSSAATQLDGAYQVSGLFPGSYFLKLSAPGFTTSYFPDAPDLGSAQTVAAQAGVVSASGTATVTGLPATIIGEIDPGDVTDDVITTVTARLLQQGAGEHPVSRPTTVIAKGEPGQYILRNLPAPGNYELTFAAEGYETTTLQTSVAGGAKRFESTMVLGAGRVQLSGLVTDGDEPLGGAIVSTTVDGKEISTATPTTGEVGRFRIANLPTPATYVMTISKEGYGEISEVIDLAPGEAVTDLEFVLQAGTGVVTGRLFDLAGDGVGGATVTVGGLAEAPSTITVTDGEIGSFRLAGLPTPGAYTLTFTLDGWAQQTVPITLEVDAPLDPISAVMTASSGSISGHVRGPNGSGIPNISVVVTDGQRTWPASTTSAGSAVGSYAIADIPPGRYTVTASDEAGNSQTTLVTVDAGATAAVNLHLVSG